MLLVRHFSHLIRLTLPLAEFPVFTFQIYHYGCKVKYIFRNTKRFRSRICFLSSGFLRAQGVGGLATDAVLVWVGRSRRGCDETNGYNREEKGGESGEVKCFMVNVKVRINMYKIC